ncbi:LysR family transcriptional regulator [Microbulbifer litoralis]|uniref:LysR family transcriptional regulator n=1 Tax=Microbulbifer litoralis TaxID=2933965 RepID=UPI00202796AE|nr:LysR family transcriptional regulator [Microbulbifer sp. GX H0434]
MDTKRLDLNLLATLEALLEERNVTRAAARLHLSQPAVSAQLNRLRDMFNDPLLIPAQRGMTPTTMAQELLTPLRQALDQVRDTVVTHRHFDPALAELTVTIACTDYLQSVIGLTLIQKLRQQAPGIRLAIRNLEPPRLESQMVRGEVDLALMTPDEAPPTLRTRHLYDEHYVLVGRLGHPQLGDNMSLEEYARLEHIVVSLSGGDFLTPVDQALQALGHTRNVVLSVASFLFVPEMVARSHLVALVPWRLVAGRTDLKLVKAPAVSTGFSVGMVWHERNHGHGAHRWVREQMGSCLEA